MNFNLIRVTSGKKKIKRLEKKQRDFLRGDGPEPEEEPLNARFRPNAER